MNRLARTIRKMNEENQDLDDLGLSSIEKIALQIIRDLIQLSPQDLANHLSQQVDPSEWIMPPAQFEDNHQIC